jgi:hypothetical protein
MLPTLEGDWHTVDGLSELTTIHGSLANTRSNRIYRDDTTGKYQACQLWFVLLLFLCSISDEAILLIDGGGGARTLSQLQIMGQIMCQLNEERYTNESEKIMRPCEHFDLMGGSGTGG